MVKLHPDISSPVFADLNRYFAPKHDVFPSLTRWVIYSEDWVGMRHCKKDHLISINPQCKPFNHHPLVRSFKANVSHLWVQHHHLHVYSMCAAHPHIHPLSEDEWFKVCFHS